MRFVLLIIAIITFLPNAQAQENDASLESYEPPPLFGAPRTPPPREVQKKIDIIDKVSKEVIETKKPQQPSDNNKKMLIQPRVIKQQDGEKANETQIESQPPTPPKPPKSVSNIKAKPQEISNPITKPKPKLKPVNGNDVTAEETFDASIASKTEIKNNPDDVEEEPIDLLKSETLNKKTSTGVVTGPKTMPSVKKKSVVAEQTFVSKDIENGNFQQRDAQPVQTTMKLPPAKEKLPSHISADQKQFVFKYGPGKVHMSDNMVVTTLSPLSSLIRGNGKNIEIKAYASKVSSRLNSDKKIALDRGLALREYFVSKGIKKHRINLKSYGNKTSAKSADYIEINILD